MPGSAWCCWYECHWRVKCSTFRASITTTKFHHCFVGCGCFYLQYRVHWLLCLSFLKQKIIFSPSLCYLKVGTTLREDASWCLPPKVLPLTLMWYLKIIHIYKFISNEPLHNRQKNLGHDSWFSELVLCFTLFIESLCVNSDCCF